jgi:hypothetical protein
MALLRWLTGRRQWRSDLSRNHPETGPADERQEYALGGLISETNVFNLINQEG